MPKSSSKKLRSGFSTGACAAVAAKGAALSFLLQKEVAEVEIPFPDEKRRRFILNKCKFSESMAAASIIKDAGDDPDITNGAEVVAHIARAEEDNDQVYIKGGAGVGVVTKPGLAVEIGLPAINPIPLQMIKMAVQEAMKELSSKISLVVTISIVNGEELAKKTLNRRLGIIGGLSVLGTTGIVRPVSADAWTATISASMAVAKAAGRNEVVLSTGRTSEAAVQKQFSLPDDCLVMMGDYLQFSLKEAAKSGFTRIHLAAMWAKVLKGAMKIPQTHVRNGALETDKAIIFLSHIGVENVVLDKLKGTNNAREIYMRLCSMNRFEVIEKVCRKAQEFAQDVSGVEVFVHLVDSEKKVVCSVK